ncbi:MAG: hypothetical protein U9Q81_12420 [Pseudomonadota bacterium]|nr:hypothetical protein [Pseudomonadota bacterium]
MSTIATVAPPQLVAAKQNEVQKEFEWWVEGLEPGSAVYRYFEWVQDHLLPRYVAWDRSAMWFQRMHQRCLRVIYVGSALIVALVSLQALFFPHLNWLIWLEVIGLLAMLWFWFHDKDEEVPLEAQSVVLPRRGYHSLWLRDRVLAEKLRCAIFALAVCEQKDMRLRDRYFPLLSDESADDEVDLLVRAEAPGRPSVELNGDVRDYIDRHWLGRQENYHRKKKVTYERRLHRRELLCGLILALTLVIAFTHALGVGHDTPLGRFAGAGAPCLVCEANAETRSDAVPPVTNVSPRDHAGARRPTFGHALAFLALLLPAVSAAINAMNNGLELKKIALRSARAAEVIGGFRKRLSAIEDADQAKEFLLGEVIAFFLRENEDWYTLVAHRHPEVG